MISRLFKSSLFVSGYFFFFLLCCSSCVCLWHTWAMKSTYNSILRLKHQKLLTIRKRKKAHHTKASTNKKPFALIIFYYICLWKIYILRTHTHMYIHNNFSVKRSLIEELNRRIRTRSSQIYTPFTLIIIKPLVYMQMKETIYPFNPIYMIFGFYETNYLLRTS